MSNRRTNFPKIWTSLFLRSAKEFYLQACLYEQNVSRNRVPQQNFKSFVNENNVIQKKKDIFLELFWIMR